MICPPFPGQALVSSKLGLAHRPLAQITSVVKQKPHLPSGWQLLSGLWPWWCHEFGVQPLLSTAGLSLSCGEDPCCSCIGNNLDRAHPAVSYKLASFQKDGEGAITSLDLYVLVVLVWDSCILLVPSWKRIYVHKFCFFGLQKCYQWWGALRCKRQWTLQLCWCGNLSFLSYFVVHYCNAAQCVL